MVGTADHGKIASNPSSSSNNAMLVEVGIDVLVDEDVVEDVVVIGVGVVEDVVDSTGICIQQSLFPANKASSSAAQKSLNATQ